MQKVSHVSVIDIVMYVMIYTKLDITHVAGFVSHNLFNSK